MITIAMCDASTFCVLEISCFVCGSRVCMVSGKALDCAGSSLQAARQTNTMHVEKMIFFVIWQFYRQVKMMRFEILFVVKNRSGLQHSWVQQINEHWVSAMVLIYGG